MVGTILDKGFFAGPALEVARALLGKTLCRALDDGTVLRLPLTEVEAYDGPEDRASHAHRGRTPRNAIMFGEGGYWYVYLNYGIHWLMNIVTGPVDYPAAILLRAAGPVVGPGRLSKALQVTGALHRQPVQPGSGLWVEDAPPVPDAELLYTPRIGIGYAGDWIEMPYRLIWEPQWAGRKATKPAGSTGGPRKKSLRRDP